MREIRSLNELAELKGSAQRVLHKYPGLHGALQSCITQGWTWRCLLCCSSIPWPNRSTIWEQDFIPSTNGEMDLGPT